MATRKKSEYPFSECKRKDKIGKRYVNSEHFSTFKWLGLSNLDDPDIKGLWCVYCALFKTSDSGGGRGAITGRGGGQN